ncbi:proton myo-inositol cotransporter-like protein [Dermatophagoides farinae]|nr:proton myo-inositol cotransporter-like [Dermatophagoides farinae]KAH7637422.1 proton myo-inositol cotransporter-like protein [Dermatophagoides farinae]
MGITPHLQQTPSATNNVGDGDSVDERSTTAATGNDEYCSKVNWYIYLVTILSAIGGFLFGYDTGIVSGAMVFIRDYFNLSTTMQEVVISVTILTAWIFSFIAGYLTNKFGRKLTIILASFIFTIGGFMMAFAHTEYILLVGRAIIGLAIGLASMAIPVYIAEVAPVDIRGKLVSVNVCFITFGQFIASIVAGLFSYDQHNGWRWMLGLASVPSTLQMIFFVFLPESPRWLVQKGRYEDALNALRKFRNANTSDEKIIIEFTNIKESCLNSERERKNDKSYRQILSNPIIMKALFVGSMLSIFQQVAGINTVMYYSATIIQMSGINDKSTAVWLSALTASINFIFSFVGLVLVERIGRRLLILSSLCGVVFSLFILSIGFQLAKFHSPRVTFHSDDQIADYCSSVMNCDACVSSKICGFCFYQPDGHSDLLGSLSMSNVNGTCIPMNQTSNLPFSNSSYCTDNSSIPMQWAIDWCPSEYSWMTLAGLMLYLFFFAPGMGPMPWTINSEIYPLWARSFCYSVSTSFNWFFNLLISLTFLTLTNLLTIYGAFYLYAGLSLFGLVMFFFILPETKGKKLEEIECLFQEPLFRIGLNAKKLSQYDQVDGSVNASRSTVVTNASNESNAVANGGGGGGGGTVKI